MLHDGLVLNDITTATVLAAIGVLAFVTANVTLVEPPAERRRSPEPEQADDGTVGRKVT